MPNSLRLQLTSFFLALGALASCALNAMEPSEMTANLCRSGGGAWTIALPITVENKSSVDFNARPITLTITRNVKDRRNLTSLIGQQIEALRVCNSDGAELLFNVKTTDETVAITGVVQDGYTLTFPATVGAKASATYYVFYGNERAYYNLDCLEDVRRNPRNLDFEEGRDVVPIGWRFDDPDSNRRMTWRHDAGEAFSGEKCVRCDVATGADPTWIAARQTDVALEPGARYKFSARVRGKDVAGRVGWYLHLGNSKNAMLASPMLYAEREGDYGKVAEIRYSKLKALEDDIKAIQQQLATAQNGDSLVREEVTADDIAEVVSRWTGIPVTKMMQSEREKLLHLEAELHKRVIGQDEAITAVSDAVRRSRAGLQDPKRPIASFIFLGTTGVGKTELAKTLADYLFNDETMMTRIDMSEYQEKYSVSRLIGAPPGYVGYDEGGQLTEAVRRKPYSVVLFDEIEKAHPDVFNILLQVLDDGRLTDNKGRTANFKNTIIIMTSNATREQLRQTMRPEFLNRIDEIITFTPLTKEQIADVVRLQMKKVSEMLEPQGIHLECTPQAISYLAEEGYDPDFGARPVKRAIQQFVLNDLSKKLLADEVDRDKPIIIDEFGEGLVFRN